MKLKALILVFLMLAPVLNLFSPTFCQAKVSLNEVLETAIKAINPHETLRPVTVSEAKAIAIVQAELYKTLSADDIWELVRVARGEPPSKELLSKLESLGVEKLDSLTAVKILRLLEVVEDTDPDVIVTKYGYINLKNSYAHMERWITTLSRVDKNLNKIADSLENRIGRVKVVVAAADGELEKAISTFLSLGGELIGVYESIGAFSGYIDASKLQALVAYPWIGFVEEYPSDFKLCLAVSVPQLRFGTNDQKYVTIASYPAFFSTPWAKGLNGTKDLAVAILDTGIDYTHPEFGTYSESVSYTTVYYSNNVPIDTSGRNTVLITLESNAEYYVAVTWTDTTEDYTLYIAPPGSNTPYVVFQGSGTIIHGWFYSSYSGDWNFTIVREVGSGTSVTLVVKKLSRTVDWAGKIIGWRDFTTENKTSPYDGYGHGTLVASVVAARGYNLAYQGAAPEARLFGVRVFDSSGTMIADVLAVLEWLRAVAQNYGIAVALLPWTTSYSATLNEAVNNLVRAGIVAVVPAGNDGYQASVFGSPASADLPITVGAVNDLNEMAAYSSSAPVGTQTGDNTIKPDVTANGGSGKNRSFDTTDENGDGIYGVIGGADSNYGSWSYSTPAQNDYADANGTSLAAAHVAALADILVQAIQQRQGSWSFTQDEALLVKALILMTAVEFTRTEGSTTTEPPVPPLNRGEKDPIEGYGRINADAAVMAYTTVVKPGDVITYSLGTSSTTDADQVFAPRVWAAKIWLNAGESVRLFLDVPSTADFDIYVYKPRPNEYGEPVLAAWSNSSGAGVNEAVTVTADTDGYYYIVVKWVDDPANNYYGEFKLYVTKKLPLGSYDVSIPDGNAIYYIEGITTSLIIRVHNVPAGVNAIIRFQSEADGLPVTSMVNSNGAGEGEMTIYVPGDTAVYINVTGSTGALLDVIPIVNSIAVETGGSVTIDGTLAFAVNITGLNATGKYAFEATPENGQDIDIVLLDSVGSEISSVNQNAAGGAKILQFTAGASFYYAIVRTLSGSGTISYYLHDAGPPTLTASWSLENNSYTNGDTVNVTWTSSDIESRIVDVKIFRNGTQVYPTTGTGESSGSYQVSLPSDGIWNITIVCWDLGGNIDKETLFVIRDTVPPNIWVLSPANVSYHNKTWVIIDWDYYDRYGVDYFEIGYNGTNWVKVYDTLYNLTLPGEGCYIVIIRGVDFAGNMNETNWIIYIDLTPPTIESIYPPDGSYWNSSDITISWTASDNYVIDCYYIKMDTGEWKYVGQNQSYTFTNVYEGGREIWIKVFDKAGNYYVTKIIIHFDYTPPVFLRSYPANGTYINVTSFAATWSFDDNYEISEYYYSTDGVTWYSAGLNTSVNVSYSAEGIWRLYITAYDKAGNKKSVVIEFIIDLTPPQGQILSPKSGEFFNVSYVELKWNASDNYALWMYIIIVNDSEGIKQYEVTDPSATSYQVTDIADGEATITLRILDKAGNKYETTIKVKIDTEPPTIEVTNPTNNGVYNTSVINVTWTITDLFYVLKVYIIVDGGDPIPLSNKTTSYLLNLTKLYGSNAEGTHSIKIVAIDEVGNKNEILVNFKVDFSPPTIVFLYPANNSYLKEFKIKVKWQAEDNFADNILKFLINVDESGFVDVGLNTSYVVELSEGIHEIVLVAYDKAGNKAVAKLVFVIDITPPKLTIIEPNGTLLLNKSTFVIKVDVWDNIQIETIEVWLGRVRLNKTTETVIVVSLQGIADGEYDIVVVARDIAGNEAKATIHVLVDRTPPTVRIIRPKDGARLTMRKIYIEWKGEDNIELVEYLISIDEGEWISVDLRNWYRVTLDYGVHFIKVRAVDKVGNYAEHEIKVIIAEKKARISPLSAMTFITVAFIGLLGFVFIKKRKARVKRKEPARFRSLGTVRTVHRYGSGRRRMY